MAELVGDSATRNLHSTEGVVRAEMGVSYLYKVPFHQISIISIVSLDSLTLG